MLESFRRLDVSNVFIYVGDSVRWDLRPEGVGGRGVDVKSIAASTHSPSSFASLITGRYALNHGVSMFSHGIAPDEPTIFDATEEAEFFNSIFAFAEREHGEATDPIYSVLNVDPPDGDLSLDNLAEPFMVMERGPGGHAPYGDFLGTATDYFMGTSDETTLKADYQESISMDESLFETRLKEIEDGGIAEDTLVVYTSDHGELLGEGGILGHNAPMRPELVYIPTVLIHPDLPDRTVENATVHHVDLLPTVFDVLRVSPPAMARSNGRSILNGLTTDPRPSYYCNRFPTSRFPFLSGELQYEGVWDADGGHTFARSSALDRLAVIASKLGFSSKRRFLWKHAPAAVWSYARSDRTFGRPGFSRSDARAVLKQERSRAHVRQEAELSESAERRLEELGYR